MCYRLSLLLFLLNVPQLKSDSCTLLSGEQGQCVPLAQCPALLQAFINPINGTQDLLRKLLCGKQHGSSVCCADGWNATVYGKVFHNKKYCGYQHKDDYLYEQNTTSIDEFPWLVVIRGIRMSTSEEVFTHGTLISNRYILTAAGSLLIPVKWTHVLLGEYHIKTETDCVEYEGLGEECTESETYGIEEIIPHPLFYNGGGLNDIALLRLDRKVFYSDYSRPICLPENDRGLAKPGEALYITGWGKIWEHGEVSVIKKKIKTVLMAEDDCNKFLKETNSDVSLYFNMCTVDSEDNVQFSCTDDIGGPIMFAHKHQWYLEGIISKRAVFCSSVFPGINTRIFTFLDWIKQNIRP